MAQCPPSLRSLFLSAKSKEARLQITESSNTAHEDLLQDTTAEFEECRKLIERLAMFSPNETSEDIATSAIQYLGVDYMLAELLLKTYGPDRRQLLQQASELMNNFLSRLDSYKLLSKQDRELWEQYQIDRKGFQLASTSNPAERRRIKVARFQLEKDLKAKLELLKTRTGQNSVDEEIIRRLYFTELELFTSRAFQLLDMIVQEDMILAQAQSDPQVSRLSPDSREHDRSGAHGYSERVDRSVVTPGGPLLSKEGKPLRPFTIMDKRSQLQQGVFRPGHSLPTMTIDDYLEAEKRRGGMIDASVGSQERGAKPDEDNMDLADQETMKARAWDEYVEANPKGSGNTMNRG